MQIITKILELLGIRTKDKHLQSRKEGIEKEDRFIIRDKLTGKKLDEIIYPIEKPLLKFVEEDDYEPYFIYDSEDEQKNTWSQCYECGKEFEDGDKVYMSDYYHDLDCIAPFPYCKSCISAFNVSEEL